MTADRSPVRRSPFDVDEIRRAVRHAVAAVLGLDVAAVTLRASLIGMGAESFHFIELVIHLEKAFDVRIDVPYAVLGRQPLQALVTTVEDALAERPS